MGILLPKISEYCHIRQHSTETDKAQGKSGWRSLSWRVMVQAERALPQKRSGFSGCRLNRCLLFNPENGEAGNKNHQKTGEITI